MKGYVHTPPGLVDMMIELVDEEAFPGPVTYPNITTADEVFLHPTSGARKRQL